MGDFGIRALTRGEGVRVVAVDTTESVAEAARRHGSWPTATAALGRLLTAAALFGALMKDETRITLRLMGDGPLGTLIADSRPEGRIRGYVQNPQVDLPLNQHGKLDVGGAVGKNGIFSVARDYGRGTPYSGSSQLVSGEVGEDVAFYLARSEQIPSVVSLGVLVERDGSVRSAGGILVQAMPGSTEETLDRIEQNSARLADISRRLDRGVTLDQLVADALEGLPYDVHEMFPVRFSCSCSKERVGAILGGFSKKELEEMLSEREVIEVRCHFCNEIYRFTEEEVEELIRKI